MRQGILKRNPDSGVATAVSSIIEHQKFKRMLMFGLRSLSDFCSSSVQLYLENAMDALDRDVVPSIHQAVSNFGDDEELAQSASKILFAMSLAVAKESNNALSVKLANDGGVATVILIIDHVSVECETLEFCVEFLLNMDSFLKSHASTFNFVKHLIGFAENKTISPALLLKVVSIFHSLSEFDNGISSLESSNALVHLFKYALDLTDSSIDLPLAIFKLLKKLSSKVKCDLSLEYAINLMEKFRSNRNVLERGNDAVKLLIGPERLEHCLTTLQKGESGSNEYKTAIITLKSLSYITDAASEIAKGGGAVLLLDLVSNVLNSKDQEEKEAVISGSCAMLTRLSLHPDCVNDLLAKGIIETLTNVLISCKNNIICIAAAAEALSKSIQIPDSSARVKKSKVFEIALPLLYEFADKTEAIYIMELVHSGTLNSDFLEIIVSSNGLEIVAACCQYHLENVNFHALAVSSLNNLSSLEINLKAIGDYGGLVGISTSLTRNSSDVNYSFEALKVLTAFSSNNDATKYMCDGTIAEACLKCMIEHQDNQKIIELGTKCLEVIATERDLQRNTNNLKDILLNFAEMGDKPFTMLASISGLSKIERLKQVLVNGKIINIIMDSVGCLIDQPVDQNLVATKIALIKSALGTTTNLNYLQDESDTNTIQVFSDLSCLSNVKKLVEIEQSEDNLLLNFIENMKVMSSYFRNLSEDGFAKALESLLKIMRKYQDIRRVQIVCMDAIYNLISTSGPFYSSVIIGSGLVNGVVTYLQRVPMYTDVQLAGLKLLLLCSKSDRSDTVVKCLIDCGSLGVIKTASRTHVRNIQLKPILGSLMSMLLPTDAIEQELVELLKQCQDHADKNDLYNLQLTITCINQLLASQDAIKIALKVSILTRLRPLVSFAVSHKKPTSEEGGTYKEMHDSCLSELSHIFFNACQLRLGRVAATKQETVKDLVNLYKSLEPPVNTHTSETAASTLETLSILLKHDRENANLGYEGGFCEQMCEGIKLFYGSTIVMNATCACLASFCTTEKRVEAIVQSKGFASLAESLISSIASEGKRDVILNGLIALVELFKTEIPILLKFFALNTNAIPALFGILSNYPYDRQLVSTASECLEKLVRYENPDLLSQSDNSTRMFILDNAMNCNKDDVDTLGNILQVLVDVLGADANLLKQSGVFETISNLMNLHQDNQRINFLAGKIVGILGADEQIKIFMKYIIEQGLAHEIVPQNVDSAASKLAMFLASPLNDRKNALQYTEECLKAMNNVIAYLASNERLLSNLSAVSRRLCESAYDDMEDQFGAWAVASSANLNQLANVFVTTYGLENASFLTNCFFVFASCQHNTYTKESMENICNMILPLLDQILKKYSGNMELVHSLLKFLNELKLKNLSDLGCDADQLIELVRKYKDDDAVVIPIMEIFSTMISSNESGANLDAILAKVAGLMSMPLSEGSTHRQKAYLAFSAAIASKGAVEKSQIQNLFNLYDSISSSENLDPSTALIISKLIESLAGDKEMASCVLDKLEKLADDHGNNVDVIVGILQSLTAFAKHNPLTSGEIVNHPVLANLKGEMLANKDISAKVLELLECLATIPGISSLVLERLEMLGKTHPPLKENPNYKRIFDILTAERNTVKTCKMIYEELGKLDTDKLDPSFQTDNITALLNLMTKYNSNEMETADQGDGADFTYGCLAFEMIGSTESRCQGILATDFPALLIDALSKQRDFKLLNTIVTSCCHLCQHRSVAAKVIQAPTKAGGEGGGSQIIASYFGKLEGSNVPSELKEDYLINALLLIAQTAINRKIYTKTSIVVTSIKIWNDYDKKIYSKIRLMRQLFRTIRNVVNETHLEALIKEDIIKRIKLLVDTCKDLYLLPDAFFLIGSMAAVPTIKSQMGESGLLESLVKAQKDYIDGDTQSNALLTNCCLALANMCIDYKPNCDIFQKFGGPDLNVKIINKFSKVPEIVNGASILLCNALYKNDGLKALYGHNGGPAALIKCLSQFSGICEKPTLRCVEILLKSISNLSLNANNLEYFLKCEAEKAFERWMTGLNNMDKSGFDSTAEDQLFHVGFQTLSNLLAENTKESMEKFSILIIPSINILKSARLSAKSIILLFDILSSLSRLPANCAKFGQDGIPLIVSTLRRFDYDVELLSLGIHLLSLQSYTPEGTLLLLKSNVFDILIGTLQVDPDDSDCLGLIISSLRCIRRIISSSEIAYFFCGVGGVAPLVDVFKKAVNHHMLMVEAGRLLLGLLSFTDKGDTKGGDNNKGNNCFEGWKNIELSASDVNNILLSVITCSTEEGYKRIISLQKVALGICGYFSQVGIGYEAMASANLSTLLQEVLTYCYGNPCLVESVAHILYGLRIAPPDLISTIVPKSVNKVYRESIKKMPNRKPAEKEIYRMAESAIERLDAPSKLEPGEKLSPPFPDGFNFALSGWDVDPYPNGVQDLPQAVKDALRKGDKCTMITNDLSRVSSKWRSTQDLNCLEWGPEESNYPNRVPILRIKNIASGIKSPILEGASRRDSRKVTQRTSACIICAPTVEFPEGISISLLFKGQKQRDEMVELLTQWRDAASYNH